jgi:2-keto-3-deoxy-L-rhamnonate aldolase RhmA
MPVVLNSSLNHKQAASPNGSLNHKKAASPCFDIRSALRQRKLTVGSWLQLASPGAAEILANVGYDWLGLDCEHTAADTATVENIARAVFGRGPSLLVRVKNCETLEIRRALDMGAQGVIVPMIETPEQAKQAVAAAKYPPEGVRGFCFGRMNDWGAKFDEYAQKANAQIAVVAMIESRKGVENVDAIASVPGIDGLFIGPYDLSGSYGAAGCMNHPGVLNGRKRVVEAAAQAGISAGLHLVRVTRETYECAIAEGFTFVCLDGDIIFLDQAARERFSYI